MNYKVQARYKWGSTNYQGCFGTSNNNINPIKVQRLNYWLFSTEEEARTFMALYASMLPPEQYMVVEPYIFNFDKDTREWLVGTYIHK